MYMLDVDIVNYFLMTSEKIYETIVHKQVTWQYIFFANEEVLDSLLCILL